MDWIDVKDKVPPQGWMIICYRYYADPKILHVDFGLHCDEVFTSSGIIRDVTHWMLLPNPPENHGMD